MRHIPAKAVPTSSSDRSILPAAAIVAVWSLLVFLPALNNEFVNWDDDLNFTTNADYRGLAPANLRWMFTTFHMGHYHPLTWITLGFDYALWQLNPVGYHLTNMLLHAATAVAVVYLTAAFFRPTIPRKDLRSARALAVGAGLAGALFALHPLRVESVAWATERRDCLSGLFFVLTLWAYLRYADGMRDRQTRRRAYLLAILFLTLSLLSKAWGITIPVILLILDIYPLRRLEPGRWLASDRRSVWIEKIPFLALAAVAAWLARLAQIQVGAMRSTHVHGIPQRIAQAAYGTVFYLLKTIWPDNLHTAHVFFHQLNPFAPAFVASIILVVLITLLLLPVRRRWPALLAAWAAYVVILSPVLGLTQSGVQLVADRYTYLACLPWAILAGVAAARAWQRYKPVMVLVPSLLVLSVLSVLTWRQVHVWRNSFTLWDHTLEIDPGNVIANLHKGDLFAARKDYEGGIALYRKAFERAPDYDEVHANLGISLAALNRFAEAEPSLLFAVAAKPRGPSMRALAVTQVALGRPEARGTITRLLELGYADERFLNDLYRTCIQTRHFDMAIHLLRETLRSKPAHAEIARQLAWILAACPQQNLRDGPAAVRIAEDLAASAGADADPRLLDILAAAYAQAGDCERARQTATKAMNQADAAGDSTLQKEIHDRLERYAASRPCQLLN